MNSGRLALLSTPNLITSSSPSSASYASKTLSPAKLVLPRALSRPSISDTVTSDAATDVESGSLRCILLKSYARESYSVDLSNLDCVSFLLRYHN